MKDNLAGGSNTRVPEERVLKLAVVDVDGTLTEKRGSFLLPPDSILAIRLLKCKGIKVSLVSGNSLPVVAGLAVYLGADIAIGENGCVALLEDGEEIHVCKSRPPSGLIEELLSLGFRESWQNKFRAYDLAFYPPSGRLEESVRRAKTVASRYGFKTSWSGYALHVHPAEGGKERGVEAILERLGLDWSEVLAVGDGDNDIFMLSRARVSVTLADASDLAKRASAVVSGKLGGAGVLEALLRILGYRDYSKAIASCVSA